MKLHNSGETKNVIYKSILLTNEKMSLNIVICREKL